MNGQIANGTSVVVFKIARLAEERGWTQEEFARQTGLHRQTICQIMRGNDGRRLRNDTIGRCARALGLAVNELRHQPLDQLLARVRLAPMAEDGAGVRRLYELATQPELRAWLDRFPDRARQLSAADIDELLSLQGTGGPLTRLGVEHYVDQIVRKRKLVDRVEVVAGTEYLPLLEQLVDLLYDKIRPYADRA